MDTDVQYCDIIFSWLTKDTNTIYKYVVYRTEGVDTDDSSTVLPTELLYLNSPREDYKTATQKNNDDTKFIAEENAGEFPPCMVTCKCRNPPYNVNISAVDVLCNAKHIEIFSSTGEYVSTSRGIRIDEAPETDCTEKLFLLQHTFDEPLSKFSFKLVGSAGQNSICLHSIHITVCEASQAKGPNVNLGPLGAILGIPGTSNIDVDKVRARLADMNVEVSDGAQSLLTTIQSQKKSRDQFASGMGKLLSSQNGPPSFASMMAMFAGMPPPSQKPEIPGSLPEISELKSFASIASDTKAGVNTLLQDATKFKQDHNSSGTSSLLENSTQLQEKNTSQSEDQYPTTSAEGDLESLRSQIFCEMHAMEARLVSHINTKLAQMEHRLQSQIFEVKNTLSSKSSQSGIELD